MQDTDAAGNALAEPADASPADAARRLGAALDRIARLAPRAHAGAEPSFDSAPGPDPSDVAARLDRLIAQLRGALGAAGADGTWSHGAQSRGPES